MTKRKTTRDRFEAHWRRTHRVMAGMRSEVWLERDDIWGKGSYAQPTVHFAWLAFKAGWKERSKLLSWHDDYVVTETRCTGEEVQALMSEAADEIERLEARLAGAERDAKRYRWLRSEEANTDPRYFDFWLEFSVKLCREGRMDALIDSAIAAREDKT